jgi:REG-2-like HAD superfamily hydrolase
MSLSRFRLITFDVTDTLIQFRTSPGKQYGEIGAMFGVLLDSDQLAHNFKYNWQKMNRAHPNFGCKTKIGWENWWKMLISDTFKDTNVKITEEKMTKLSNHLINVYKTSACWQHTFGAIDFLNYLKIQQTLGAKNNKNHEPPFKLGVISNFDHRLDILLRNMKINHFFDFVLNSYDAGVEKPDSEIFKIAMRYAEIDNLKPEECLHIGDTPTTDYLGARKAGWFGALIHERDSESLRRKYGEKLDEHNVFSSLFDLHKKMSSNFISW